MNIFLGVIRFILRQIDIIFTVLHHSISCVGAKKEVALVREVLRESLQFFTLISGISGGGLESSKNITRQTQRHIWHRCKLARLAQNFNYMCPFNCSMKNYRMPQIKIKLFLDNDITRLFSSKQICLPLCISLSKLYIGLTSLCTVLG